MPDAVTTNSSASFTGAPFDAAVVIATILRPSLERAVQSVYRQRFGGRIQILIGIDKAAGDRAILDRLREQCPAHCALTIVDPGYSTAARNGGLYPEGSGGALRTVMSYLAHSRKVAYLDDDNFLADDHIATLSDALNRSAWAYSLRWYVDVATGLPLCIDQWESLGPDKGCFRDQTGGFVDTSCLMIDKINCQSVLRFWCYPLADDPTGMSADRHVLYYLSRGFRGVCTGKATSYYTMNPGDFMHGRRLAWIEQSRPAQ